MPPLAGTTPCYKVCWRSSSKALHFSPSRVQVFLILSSWMTFSLGPISDKRSSIMSYTQAEQGVADFAKSADRTLRACLRSYWAAVTLYWGWEKALGHRCSITTEMAKTSDSENRINVWNLFGKQNCTVRFWNIRCYSTKHEQ